MVWQEDSDIWIGFDDKNFPLPLFFSSFPLHLLCRCKLKHRTVHSADLWPLIAHATKLKASDMHDLYSWFYPYIDVQLLI